MTTPKEKLQELVDEHFGGNVEDAQDFVRDILENLADLIEQNEPFATISINRYRQASMHFGLEHVLGPV